MTTKALHIQTNTVVEVEIGAVEITGNLAIGYILSINGVITSATLHAELNMARPEEGWKIYPN
jgi:hypothetical protein